MLNPRGTPRSLGLRLFGVLVTLSLLLALPAPVSLVTASAAQAALDPADALASVPVIVQGRPTADLDALVAAHGGQVTRDLAVIGAVAARLPAHQIAALAHAPNVTRVWQDAAVRSSESADPGVLYAPVDGGAAAPAGFDLRRVAFCDGDKEPLEEIPLGATSPFVFQGFTFQPTLDSASLPGSVGLHVVLKEKNLNQARLEVLQASTGTWHPLEIDTLSTNDAWIDAHFDLSEILTTAEDLAEVQVRFFASRNEGGEKAEVDCVNLLLPGNVVAPVSGGMAKPSSFDLHKVASYDADKQKLDHMPDARQHLP